MRRGPALRRRLLLPTAVLVLAGAALAEIPPLPADLATHGWAELRFDGKRPNRYEALGADGIRLISDGSVSMAFRPVAAELSSTPLLTWRWRVLESGPPTALDVRGEDDRPAAVYVGFPYDPARASLWERMRRAVVELRQGADAPGKVLVYVWGGKRPAGATFESPYMGESSSNRVLRSGDAPTGMWFEERVDLAADFVASFGYPAPDPTRIAVSADSDDTASRSVAEIEGLVFAERP
ncbi:MAG: DUF3047 domain-containing protein [Acetobacterales bacterium]